LLPAPAFTKAIEASRQITGLEKQLVTLLNNRSAMYEKAGLTDLALEDCSEVLDLDKSHKKARNKRARIFESMGSYKSALSELCAMQLDFMHKNKESVLRGVPLQPPVDNKKMEDLCDLCMEQAEELANERRKDFQVSS